MNKLYILDPSKSDQISSYRGGGRILQLLKENLPEAHFITDIADKADYADKAENILIPSFNFFTPPINNWQLAINKYLVIFDVIPLKYPSHFPVGIRGRVNLWRNKQALKHFVEAPRAKSPRFFQNQKLKSREAKNSMIHFNRELKTLRFSRSGNKIITISETAKKDLISYLGLPENKIVVIYPTVSKVFLNQKSNIKNQNDPTSPSASLGASKLKFKNIKPISTNSNYFKPIPTKYALYCGDVNWNKNLVNLAKAIKLADVSCVFVGREFEKVKQVNQLNSNSSQVKQFNTDQPTTIADLPPCPSEVLSKHNEGGINRLTNLNHPWQSEFKLFLKEVGNDPRFIFPGYVSDNELLQFYNNAICNLLVSRDEGFGMSYIEAGSQGCPSVLSDIPVFHETAQNNAVFANPNDPQSIADSITKLFNNNKLRTNLGQSTKKHVLSKYSPKEFKKKLHYLFDL